MPDGTASFGPNLVRHTHDDTPSDTRWSVIAAAGTQDPAGRRALAWLIQRYWDPLRAHAKRLGCRDAEDAVQDFMVELIERNTIADADRSRGRFRAWLFVCLNHFIINRTVAATALKRGGARVKQSLDEAQHVAVDKNHDQASFDRDWALAVLAYAHDRLASEQDDALRWQLLKSYLIENGDAGAYATTGNRLGLSEVAVKVAVHRLRTRLRQLVRDGVAETLEEEDPRIIDDELDHLIAALKDSR
jgi:RNA polymerase sigma factor (sigma-70 family)